MVISLTVLGENKIQIILFSLAKVNISKTSVPLEIAVASLVHQDFQAVSRYQMGLMPTRADNNLPTILFVIEIGRLQLKHVQLDILTKLLECVYSQEQHHVSNYE